MLKIKYQGANIITWIWLGSLFSNKKEQKLLKKNIIQYLKLFWNFHSSWLQTFWKNILTEQPNGLGQSSKNMSVFGNLLAPGSALPWYSVYFSTWKCSQCPTLADFDEVNCSILHIIVASVHLAIRSNKGLLTFRTNEIPFAKSRSSAGRETLFSTNKTFGLYASIRDTAMLRWSVSYVKATVWKIKFYMKKSITA